MPEGWISSQSEMLEILDCFAQPGALKNRESSVRGIKEEQCLHNVSIQMGGWVRQIYEEGRVYDHF